jgi:hypothetical protein
MQSNENIIASDRIEIEDVQELNSERMAAKSSHGCASHFRGRDASSAEY